MGEPVNLWHWAVIHWKAWGVGAILVGLAGVIPWITTASKDWKAARKEKSERAIDSRVMEALEDRTLWKGERPMTGGGDYGVRADELTQVLSLDLEEITDGLNRLEMRGRVRNGGGNISDPTSRWHTTRRF